jgi:hypothetical protein
VAFIDDTKALSRQIVDRKPFVVVDGSIDFDQSHIGPELRRGGSDGRK